MIGKILVPRSAADVLIHDRNLFGLMLFLRGHHDLEEEFTIPDSFAARVQWPLRQLRRARKCGLLAGSVGCRSSKTFPTGSVSIWRALQAGSPGRGR